MTLVCSMETAPCPEPDTRWQEVTGVFLTHRVQAENRSGKTVAPADSDRRGRVPSIDAPSAWLLLPGLRSRSAPVRFARQGRACPTSCTGRKCAEGFKEAMRIQFDDFLPKWNYQAIPEA
jgi:hypothetical protein